jgi:glucose uptake protein GlcU
LVQGLLFVSSLFIDWNTAAWHKAVYNAWAYLFFFSLANTIIVVISGIVFLTERKTIKLGILGLISAGLFLWYAIQIGMQIGRDL